MAVVTACRSDMSRRGLAPDAHLADGRLQLILVRDTSRFHYLRFMASIPRTGPPSQPGVFNTIFNNVPCFGASCVLYETNLQH